MSDTNYEWVMNSKYDCVQDYIYGWSTNSKFQWGQFMSMIPSLCTLSRKCATRMDPCSTMPTSLAFPAEQCPLPWLFLQVNVHFKRALYSPKRALYLSFILLTEPYFLVQNCYLFSTGISTNLAMCTVMVIQYHCSQTFSTHLDWGEGRSLVRRWFRMQPRYYYFLVKFLLTNSWSLGTKFLSR